MRPGYDKAPCQDSTGKGCAEEETNHVHCGKLSKRNFCPTSVYMFIIIIVIIIINYYYYHYDYDCYYDDCYYDDCYYDDYYDDDYYYHCYYYICSHIHERC